jgi:ElaB/YqjD/DUF883 family membrane-anchored ribosome-binding protein
MAQRTGHSQRPIEERRAEVTENLGRVEERVQETVDAAKAAVEEVLERVNMVLKDTIEGVKTTVERIDPAQLQQNPWTIVKTTAELVDPAHMHQNPWILIGSAIVMGYLLGTLERGSLGSEHPSSTSV